MVEQPKQSDPIKDFTDIPVIDKFVIDDFVVLIPKHISKETFEARIDPVLHAYFNVKETIPKGQKEPEKKAGGLHYG